MTNSPATSRLRFRLRSAFVFVTVLAVGLGIIAERRRGSVWIDEWDQELRNFICEKVAQAPRDTTPIDAPDVLVEPSQTPVADGKQFPRLPAEERASLTYSSPLVTLDVSAAFSTETPAELAQRLLRHYESGLEDHGMVRKSIQLCSFGPSSTEPSAIWLSERPELGAVVTIDVHVEESTRTATIQIRHVSRPSRGLW